jgi:hypothetical protein
MKYIKIIVYILLVLIAISIFGYFFRDINGNHNMKNIDFWEKNECTRGIPEPIFDSNIVEEHTFKLDLNAGKSIEEFYIDGVYYAVGQYGCYSFNIKFLLPIEKETFYKRDNKDYVYKNTISVIDTLLKKKDSSFIKIIRRVLDSELKSDLIHEYNHRIYEKDGRCG